MSARAADELGAINQTLILLGEEQISSLSGGSLAARTLPKAFAGVRDALLRRHPWNFATRRATLSADPDAPPGSFSTGYALPADCLRVRAVTGAAEDDWAVEDGAADRSPAPSTSYLYTDITAPEIVYTRLVAEVARWDALFLEIFTLELAAAAGATFGQSRAESEAFSARAAAKLAAARRIDEREAARSKSRHTVSYVAVRR